MHTRDPITISGAGLAGSLLATLLARRGFRVQVYEKRADMRRQDVDAGRSINLALANRGIRALRKAGVFGRIEPLLIPMRGRMIHDRDGDLDFQRYGQRSDEIIFSVSRAELNKTLMTAAEETGRVDIHFNQAVEDVDFESGRLSLCDVGGTASRTDESVTFATDGAGSPVRRTMQRELGVEVSEEILGHGYKELTIPAKADGGFRMEPEALHIWPRGGYMLIALPNVDGSFTVTLFLPNRGEPGFDTLDTAEDVQALFRRDFPDAFELIPDLASLFFANPTGHLGTVRSRPWHADGRALLIGDAAHAIVPFHGQGMNCAFEDCAEIDELLDRHERWEPLFEAFTRTRKPDADAIADMALENYVEMRDSVRDPRFQLKKEIGWELERRHPHCFVPRYSMVMFRHVPYAEAYERGRVQNGILERLLENAESLDDVDWELADRLVGKELAPLPSDELAKI